MATVHSGNVACFYDDEALLILVEKRLPGLGSAAAGGPRAGPPLPSKGRGFPRGRTPPAGVRGCLGFSSWGPAVQSRFPWVPSARHPLNVSCRPGVLSGETGFPGSQSQF